MHDEEQRSTAELLINELRTKRGLQKFYTDIEDATDFYRAEEYHQKFQEKHPEAI